LSNQCYTLEQRNFGDFLQPSSKLRVVIIGAGPAGLTCGHYLSKKGHSVQIIELDKVSVGGISKTINHQGYRFDIGGHRFFTKSAEVWNFWKELLPDESDFSIKSRKSRIFYKNKYFNYPLDFRSIFNNFNISELFDFALSYFTRNKNSDQNVSLEGSLKLQFGPKLYETFFKTYSEKVWGRNCDQISSDWASQRIKGLSLISATISAMTPSILKTSKIKTLIEQFHYPKFGPGMMWEKCAEVIKNNGGHINLGEKIESVLKKGNQWIVKSSKNTYEADIVISTIPFNHLFNVLQIQNQDIEASLSKLKFRSYIMVAFILNKEKIFDDNWLYIQDPSLQVSRVQNFKNWSSSMVPDEKHTTLGFEYFCDMDSEMWLMDDGKIKALATEELLKLKFATQADILDIQIVRAPNAYPIYHLTYKQDLEYLKTHLQDLKGIYTVGRGGMFRYNNQDHSIMSAIITCENILGETNRNPWMINQDAEYLEEVKAT
jgi:protoporphyrinogen oxidase